MSSNDDTLEDDSIRVCFLVQPGEFKHEDQVSARFTCAEIKQNLSNDLDIPKDNFSLSFEEEVMDDTKTLGDYGVDSASKDVIITVTIDSELIKNGAAEEKKMYLPEIIDVNIKDEAGNTTKIISVVIEVESSKKLYLGGYRNKKTDCIYHHAITQTKPEKRSISNTDAHASSAPKEKFHRDTQTVFQRSRSIQTKRESGTQMARKDLYIDESKDAVIIPGDYINSQTIAKLKYKNSIIIQCHWRGYKARCHAAKLRVGLDEKRQRVADIEAMKKSEAEERHKREISRRLQPRTQEDFEILYDELENWRLHETKRIEESTENEEERLSALAKLLHKETKLLQTIDRLKINANKENREMKIKKMLELMASPKKWALRDGEVASVHTPFTTRARELLELHNGLNLPLLTIDERLDVLLHVKWTVKEFDCNLTREIVELIDREADLLNRGRSEKSLEGLRLRISRLFLQFIETPEFNPESARFQRVPHELLRRPNIAPIHSRGK